MQHQASFKFNEPIFVIGDVMLDVYLEGNTHRISPEAPVPVLKYENKRYALGGACNVAMNLKSLGVNPILYGLIGDDEHGQLLIQLLNEACIRHHLIKTNQPTITKMRLVDKQHQLLRIDYEETFLESDSDQLINLLHQEMTQNQFCVLSDYNKGTVSNPQSIISKANHVIVDPKGESFDKYNGAFLITPNLKEFHLASRSNECSVQGLCKTGQIFRERINVQHLLITLSEKGMLLINQDQFLHEKANQTSQVSDVTGAGDTVIATLAAFLSSGTPFEKSLQLANAAAGHVVKTFGTTFVSRNDLESLNLELPINHKTSALTDLQTIVNDCKHKGKRIVFTNGCFDIIHPGHIMLLQKAKSLGDVLIVGVNSDDSIRRLKGQSRPINHLNARLNVLSGLESIDWVVSFDADTPHSLIESIKPDVLVKGGDYTLESVVGAKEVQAYGGQVVIIPLYEKSSKSYQ